MRSPELTVARVARRVASGGHSIPEDVIRRRYDRGLRNLIALYLPLCDNWIIYENSYETAQLVAEGSIEEEQIIYNIESWNQITKK
ncbi:hypothetical protein [Microcoleus sp. CAWBG58]|uniref:hypothetical protein n=1 Tax=Microcoleus sp. CAWBG58 TaxID=2841651 RepID=UPI0025E1C890|nr:hypothetical protein [Microcoleus sp. CAWBG58]